MEIVNQIAFMSLLVVLMVETGSLVNAVIYALQFPDGVRLVRNQKGELEARNNTGATKPAERGVMFLHRWFFLSPCLHQLHCMAHGVQAYHKGSAIAMYALCVSVLALALGTKTVMACSLGAMCGLVVFVSTQVRGLVRVTEHVSKTAALVRSVA